MSKIPILKSNGKLLRSKYKDVIIRQMIHLDKWQREKIILKTFLSMLPEFSTEREFIEVDLVRKLFVWAVNHDTDDFQTAMT